VVMVVMVMAVVMVVVVAMVTVVVVVTYSTDDFVQTSRRNHLKTIESIVK